MPRSSRTRDFDFPIFIFIFIFLAHHVLGYVLRYAGLLDESARECDTAAKLDRRDYQLRSCSSVFFEQGNPVRAMEYLNRDAGSEWSNAVKVSVLMREGKMPEAQQTAQEMSDNPLWMPRFLQACLKKTPKTEVHRLAELAESELLPEPDPEDKYYLRCDTGSVRGNADCLRVPAKGRCRELLCAPSITNRPVTFEASRNT